MNSIQTRSIYVPLNGVVTEVDESSGVYPVECYTYIE